MNLFKNSPTVTGPSSSNGYNEKFCICLIILFAGILSPVSAKQERASLGTVVIRAVNASLVRTQNASVFISKLANRSTGNKVGDQALSDCMDNFGDAVDEITQSLSILQNLNSTSFRVELTNVQTYMSAVLTDFDSCSDGFFNVPGKIKLVVRKWVQSVNRAVSHALGLVNRYANAGLPEPYV